MAIFNPAQIAQIVREIQESNEKDRRAKMRNRGEIYRDGGRRFLIEKLRREFGPDSINEMRLAPLNLLKKIINKRSTVYKKPPQRFAKNKQDQDLIDYYTEELDVNTLLSKVNRYFNIYANTQLYVVPDDGLPSALVVPADLYSLVPNPYNRTKIDACIFNAFIEEGQIAPQTDIGSATGHESYSRQRGTSTGQDLVASNESREDTRRDFIFWSNEQHLTTDESGAIISGPFEEGINPIGRIPAANFAKERDDSVWATQGDDMIDLTIALQLGFSDLLTISKHQGWGQMVIKSIEEPKKQTLGINKVLWIKLDPDTIKDPSVDYIQNNPPIEEYKNLLLDMLSLLLSTNDMSPQAVGGRMASQNFTSGFHALIEMSDTLEAIQMDIPVLRNGEMDFWQILKEWHNFMYDNQLLKEEARKLGRFTEDFNLSIVYSEIRPIESEQERINAVKDLRAEGLMTKEDALKKLYPDMTDEQIKKKLKEIEKESEKMQEKAREMFAQASEDESQDDESEDDKESKPNPFEKKDMSEDAES